MKLSLKYVERISCYKLECDFVDGLSRKYMQ
jgi:hypothetical protein